jgi:flagellar hook-associated protein 3 FlgL
MNIRVTAQAQTAATIANLRRQSAAQAKFQDQVASGTKVKAASDDPIAFAALTQAKAAGRAFAATLEVAAEATGGLNASVSALLDGNQVLTRAKQLAITGADAGTDPAAFEGLALEVDSLIDRFLESANAQYDGDYLFGGDATTTPPYRVSGTNGQGRPTAVTYDGSATPAQTPLGGGQAVETRAAGPAVFQQAGADAFRALIQLRDTFRDTTLTDSQKTAAVGQRLAEVDAARTALGEAIGTQSAALSGLDAVTTRLQDMRLAANARTNDLEVTDFADAVVRMKQEEAAYQATLNVAASLVPPSLFDFVR